MNSVLDPTCVSQLRTTFAVSAVVRPNVLRHATLIDEYTREYLAIRVARRINSFVISRSLQPSWVWVSTKS
jgi:hypothetical protein